jgi:hypothetical protein
MGKTRSILQWIGPIGRIVTPSEIPKTVAQIGQLAKAYGEEAL